MIWLKGGIASVLFLCFLLEASIQQNVDGAWRWRNTENFDIVHTKSGDLRITVRGGKLGPYNGRIQGDKVDVKFGPRCCTGTVSKDGKKIKWSNKTEWNKRPSTPSPTKSRRNTGRPTTSRPRTVADILREIASRLSQTQGKILALTAEVKQHLDAASSYARANLRSPAVANSIDASHNQTQSSLRKAHSSVADIIRHLTAATGVVTPRPTSPRPTTRRPTPTRKPVFPPNEPAGKLQAFFDAALKTGRTESSSDVAHVDALIASITERRRKNVLKREEEKDKRNDKKTKEKEARKKARKAARDERKNKREIARQQRQVAYEHFRKRNPSQSDLDKLEKLRQEERKLRRQKEEADRKSRKKEEQGKRKTRRVEEKQKREERLTKREAEWRDSITTITREVEGAARKTIVTVGHTIQSMQAALTSSRDQLNVLMDACRQGRDLKTKYDQSVNMTEAMKGLAIKTINSLKEARKIIDSEEAAHKARVAQRASATEERELQERVEARNKRRQRERKERAARANRRERAEKSRAERHTKRSAELAQRTSQAADEAAQKQRASEEDTKVAAERKTKRDARRKQAEAQIESSQLAEQIRRVLSGVVNETDLSLAQNNAQPKAGSSPSVKGGSGPGQQTTDTGTTTRFTFPPATSTTRTPVTKNVVTKNIVTKNTA